MSSCTIIVPAHNEEAVIARCLGAMTAQVTDSLLDIVVVCNGCTDHTADVARQLAVVDSRIRVVEMAEGSKTAAIRAGFASASKDADVIAVVDADVVLSPDAAEGLVTTLAGDSALIAAPSIDVDLTGVSRAVRRYYAVWLAEPYVENGVIGAGVYAVNRAGLDRIAAMPDVLGDDSWARAQFLPAERTRGAGTFTVFPARSLPPLIKRRARIVLGNRQLVAMRATSGLRGPAASHQSVPLTKRVTRTNVADKAAYWSITHAADVLAWWRTARGHTTTWSTDVTSRRAS